MKALIFPGQGVQHESMGRDLYNNFPKAREYFETANEILGRRITDVMFEGSELELLETKNTQPAVFIYCVVLAFTQNEVSPEIVAGHSLGEYAALVVNRTISFQDGLNLVHNRAIIAQKVCENQKTAMGAVIGLSDEYVNRRINELVEETGEKVYVANYNGPGQVVITGSKKGVRIACKAFKAEGAKKAVPLPIGGSFHSPYMKEAQRELEKLINETKFSTPACPIVQCVDGRPHTNVLKIKSNLIQHITHPVLWTKMVYSMQEVGVSEYYEVGPDDTLQKIVRRLCPNSQVSSILELPIFHQANQVINKSTTKKME